MGQLRSAIVAFFVTFAMPFTPYRNAQPFALANIVTGSTINAAALNGISNTMQYLSDTGRLPITAAGTRINGRVGPVVGYAYPDLGQIRLQKKAICIPVEVPPGHNRYCMFATYRLNPWFVQAFEPFVSGATLEFDLMKAGAGYNIASATWDTLTGPLYTGSQLVTGKIPVELALSPVDTEQLYMRITLDMVNGLEAGYDTLATPYPNFSTFWNGLMSLSFATFRDCGDC